LKNRLDELNKSVDDRVNDAMSSRAGSALSFSDLFKRRSSTDSSETVKVVHELKSQDRANREYNLIVYGFPEAAGTEMYGRLMLNSR
jgi:hypothetical protein